MAGRAITRNDAFEILAARRGTPQLLAFRQLHLALVSAWFLHYLMSTPTSQLLRLPGEDARELWLREGKGAWKLAQKDDGTQGGVFAIESIALDSAPFWAPVMTEANVSLESTAALHWEALGVDTEGTGRRWLHWRVCEEEGRVLAGTMALAAEAPQDEWASFSPDNFELSARLFPILSNECAVWKELGRYVLAFTRQDKLLHVAVLNARELDSKAAWEVRDLALALEVRGFLPKLKTCHVWTRAGDEFIGTLKEALGVRIRIESKPAPQLPDDLCDVLPPEVARIREEKLRRQRAVRLITAAAFVYIAFFAAWAGWLLLREQRMEKSSAMLKAQEPQVQAVRDAQMRWSALEAATDPNTYPVEVFHQVVALLPPEGIQLKDFSVDLEKLTVGGVASSVNHALKFKADIENNEALKRYSWNFPQPTILEDNRASFRAEGTLNAGGGTNESE